MKKYLFCLFCSWLVIAIALTSCANQNFPQGREAATNPLSGLKKITVDQTKIATGQMIYVPIYSHIYHNNSSNLTLNLSATLSIRNTDPTNSIAITSIRYYDTKGKFIRQYIDQPVELQGLAATNVFIQTDDVIGGSGASFIIEWFAEQKVSPPVVEAVMISTASAQGISFVSNGRVLKQYDSKRD